MPTPTNYLAALTTQKVVHTAVTIRQLDDGTWTAGGFRDGQRVAAAVSRTREEAADRAVEILALLATNPSLTFPEKPSK